MGGDGVPHQIRAPYPLHPTPYTLTLTPQTSEPIVAWNHEISARGAGRRGRLQYVGKSGESPALSRNGKAPPPSPNARP